MSVLQVTNLPEQPDRGGHYIFGLGGSGYTSPKSCGHTLATIAGDASSGTLGVQLNLDANFQHQVYLVQVVIDGVTADTIAQASIRLDPAQAGNGAAVAEYREAITAKKGVVQNRVIGSWRPPMLMTSSASGFRPYVFVIVENSDQVELTVRVMTLQYSPQAREVTPWQYLANAFPS